MRRLWKRFTDWLHYLRHPCTIITMDKAPAKGVQINLTYTGEYPDTVENMQKSFNNALKPIDRTFTFSGELYDTRPGEFLEALLECGEHNRKLEQQDTSVTWHGNVPSNTTVKIEALNRSGWEIVKELAEKEPIAVRAGEARCVFCNTKGDLISNLRHEDTCLISRAYKLVWEKEGKVGIDEMSRM